MGKSRSHKRAKQVAAIKAQEAAAVSTCHLRPLPLEIIMEIVSWLLSPLDLLALTRTSKFFCHMFTDPSNAFVWKRMRVRFQPLPVPDPPWCYTECSWAAFIFGPNKCTLCHRANFQLPWSFACKLFKCDSCVIKEFYTKNHFTLHSDPEYLVVLKEWINLLRTSFGVSNTQFISADLLPLLEQERIYNIGTSHLQPVYLDGVRSLIGELTSVATNLEDPEAKRAYLDKKVVQRRAFTEAANEAFKWSINLSKRLKKTQRRMNTEARNFAKDAKLDYECMLATPTYAQILKDARSDQLKSIAKLLHSHKEQIVVDMEEPVTRKMAVVARESLHTRGVQLYEYYNSYIASTKYFPSFKVFKSLPSVKLLLQPSATKPVNILEDLRSEPIQRLINTDVSQWVGRAAAGARLLLRQGDDESVDVSARPSSIPNHLFLKNAFQASLFIHHSNRHETVDISLFRKQDLPPNDKKEWDQSRNVYRARPVSCAQLVLGRQKEEAAKLQFVCAHCFKPTTETFSKVFNFNALRSHVKAKHGVATIRSEDYFFDPSVVRATRMEQGLIQILCEEAWREMVQESQDAPPVYNMINLAVSVHSPMEIVMDQQDDE
ncbi:SubName: Full=Uncharacterized protein {ECO:0000313/EMBL:CCA74264.1} [Serendipita indica DSM 11827]|nr:SubName: Full=Uncharacterized protein {ECO:0000313/EMBL:CCA74264.1} [Serendipita indica DSM 11827]